VVAAVALLVAVVVVVDAVLDAPSTPGGDAVDAATRGARVSVGGDVGARGDVGALDVVAPTVAVIVVVVVVVVVNDVAIDIVFSGSLGGTFFAVTGDVGVD
jgi:hypothetical protein